MLLLCLIRGLWLQLALCGGAVCVRVGAMVACETELCAGGVCAAATHIGGMGVGMGAGAGILKTGTSKLGQMRRRCGVHRGVHNGLVTQRTAMMIDEPVENALGMEDMIDIAR